MMYTMRRVTRAPLGIFPRWSPEEPSEEEAGGAGWRAGGEGGGGCKTQEGAPGPSAGANGVWLAPAQLRKWFLFFVCVLLRPKAG
jgi:hypothetical protein